MKKFTRGLIFLAAGFSNAFAASQEMVWGNVQSALPQLNVNQLISQHQFKKAIHHKEKNEYQLRLIRTTGTLKNKHARYQLYYKNVPVWGQQMIFHSKNSQQMVTGMDVKGIEKDVTSLDPKFSKTALEKKILASEKETITLKVSKKVIYLDKNKKAHLAYHIATYTSSKTEKNKAMNYMVDAHTGELLSKWNAIRSERIGQGLGGNSLPLPYRGGMFQYGNALPRLPSLGKFDVLYQDGQCRVENDQVRLFSLENMVLDYSAFPITLSDEQSGQLNTFSYDCNEDSLFLNYSDSGSGPVNYSFSPVNDSMFFATQAIEMYQKVYGVQSPVGDDLPLRIYTHLGNLDNAFAIPAFFDENAQRLSHQQIVIGNGYQFLTAPSQTVLAHELSHLFTENNSGLFYEHQPGGINESFSDMAAIALEDYLRGQYPWYWDGEDWSLGREAMLSGEALRYMDEPSKDGVSIENAADFNDYMDPHESSGVFNKAFYLLAHKPGYSIQKAFQVMVDANQHYWSPIAYWDFAACGVMQAAADRQYAVYPVIEAFDEVGVHCPLVGFNSLQAS